MRLLHLLPLVVVNFLFACGQQHDVPAFRVAREVAAAKKTTPPPKAALVVVADFAGTYVNQDTAACRLSIAIERRNGAYFYSCDSLKGPVQIETEDGRTYFTFQGLKDDEPSELNSGEDSSISAECVADTLNIQNYGNSMNYYVRFSHCDAKFLKLVKQK